MVEVAAGSFADLLKQHRVALGLTQEALAERAGLSVRAISDLERGIKQHPYPHTVRRLVQALDLDEEAAGRLTAARRPGATIGGLEEPTTHTKERLSLPIQPTSFIGRQQEVEEVRGLLAREEVRLLTLTGPGGVGKTRLALKAAEEVVDHFPDGIVFVSLASLTDPALVPATIATALGITEVGGERVLESLMTHLYAKRMLLVVDNFEHLLPAAELVSQLLAACPQLTILVTSRAVLRLAAEHEYPVPPLAMPTPGHLPELDVLARYDAIDLFLQRTRAVKPGFEMTDENASAIAEICRRLDGLPLALELAAARVRLFPPQALLARLANRLRLLTGGPSDVPARQQTLRAAIDWSYGLLSAGERRLFTRLSVFAGGCTLEAAEAVCNADGDLGIEVLDGVASLVERSLVRQEGSDDSRFGMLETIREYASERLEAQGQAEQFQRHHAAYYLSLAEAGAPEPKPVGVGHVPWLDRLEEQQENLRAALQWSLQHSEVEIGLRLAVALHPFWTLRGYAHEGRRWLRDLLALPPLGPAPLRAAAVRTAARLAMARGDVNEVGQLARQQLELYRALDDKSGMADTLRTLAEVVTWQGDPNHGRQVLEQGLGLAREIENRPLMALFLSNLAWTALEWMNDSSRAKPLAEDALALYRELGDRRGMAEALAYLSLVARLDDDMDRAQALFREGLAVLQQVDADADIRSELSWYTFAARSWGDYAAARALAEQMLDRSLTLNDKRGSASAHHFLAWFAQEQGEYERAERFQQEALAISRELEDVGGVAAALLGLGDVGRARGDPEQIISCCSESLALFRRLGNLPFVAYCLHNLGLADWYQGDYRRAVEQIQEAISLFPSAEFMTSLGLVRLDQGRYCQARELLVESLRKGESLIPLGITATSLEGLAGVAVDQGQVARAGKLLGAADALRTRCGTPIWPAICPLYEREVEAVRATLGDEGSQAAWEDGRAMTEEQAISYALEDGVGI